MKTDLHRIMQVSFLSDQIKTILYPEYNLNTGVFSSAGKNY